MSKISCESNGKAGLAEACGFANIGGRNLNTLQTIEICDIVNDALCRTGDRGCKCRKTAGEESPGFIGQDAG